MITNEPEPKGRTTEERYSAINALSDADWTKLKIAASRFSYAMEADDLLQEAILRAINPDGRVWPEQVDPLPFLAQVMKSIASEEYEKKKRVANLVCYEGDADSQIANVPEQKPDQENHLIRKELLKTTVDEIWALFEDQPEAKAILECRIAGFDSAETQEYVGLDQKAYDTKLRLIKRRLTTKYPQGCPQ